MRALMVLLLAAALPAGAQVTVLRVPGAGAFGGTMLPGLVERARVAIGVTTTSSAAGRDTLGVLVTSVRPGSPADQAGVAEGDRIAAVNGVSLALAAADVGAVELTGAMSRRLTRELDRLKPGDDVELRLYANGRAKAVRVKTVASAELYDARPAVRRDADRATLGLNLGVTGSRRDTLGVFVMSVEDGGPAAKAGIVEGSRIAAIDGVDLRAARDGEDDGALLGTASVGRLERALAKLHPGDEAALRVYYDGQFKNVKVKTVAAADLPGRQRSITVLGGDGAMALSMEPLMGRIERFGPGFPAEVGRALARSGPGSRVVW